MTIATQANGVPYCANAFYAFDSSTNSLIFTSDETTRHGTEMVQSPTVAVSIVLETRIVGKVQGAQITGRVCRATEEQGRCDIKRFPYALVADLTLWSVEIEYIKLTDNTLGFGKKLRWKREL